jgi:uncharacterized protein YdhG (YjbR/CyaY superfamily)
MAVKGGTGEGAPARDIDEYIARAPEEARGTLETLRRTIRVAAPTATEAISYQMPTFKYNGRPLVSFAAWKSHCSLYPMSYAVIDAHISKLKDYAVEKSTIRFTLGRPLPESLVRQMVKARIAEHEAQARL